MSIYRSYFSKSNTITSDSYTNTARNPIVELFYGRVDNILLPIGFSRYIFDINLSGLTDLYDEKVISTDCNQSCIDNNFRSSRSIYKRSYQL